jgi:quinol monooxygenase YgiN
MTTLHPNDCYVTLINIFTVDPARADELLDFLSRVTEETMRHMPGFVSANLHVSLDRRQIANYAQWNSRADFETMLRNPAAQPHMREAAEIAESYSPVLYELRRVHGPGGAP